MASRIATSPSGRGVFATLRASGAASRSNAIIRSFSSASSSAENDSRLKMMFLGAPGVGKGTYASRIAPKLGIPTISTGDLVRAELKSGSELGEKLRSYNDKGLLVPDELITDMVKVRLSEPDTSKGFLLDGFPRTVRQAEDLEAFLPLSIVVNIVLKEEYLMEKIMGRRVCTVCPNSYNVAHIYNEDEGVDMPPLMPKHGDPEVCDCGAKLQRRSDDKEDIVRDRLKVYHDQTAPLVEFYNSRGVLHDFVVKKGLDDLPKLEASLASKLNVASL